MLFTGFTKRFFKKFLRTSSLYYKDYIKKKPSVLSNYKENGRLSSLIANRTFSLSIKI
jgi:hypothetical protein